MGQKIKLAVIDDHQLFRGGLIELIHHVSNDFDVILEAKNGQDALDQLKQSEKPDIALVDINMPIMDGFKTVEALQSSYPEIKLLVITMNDDHESIVRMLKLGVSGYLDKDIEKQELKSAILDMVNKGYYYNEKITHQLIHSIRFSSELDKTNKLSEREMEFVKLSCSEHTYEKIADIMCLSPKTIDGYRASVF